MKTIIFLKDYVDIKSIGTPVVVEMAEEATLTENKVHLKSGIVLTNVPEKYYAQVKS